MLPRSFLQWRSSGVLEIGGVRTIQRSAREENDKLSWKLVSAGAGVGAVPVLLKDIVCMCMGGEFLWPTARPRPKKKATKIIEMWGTTNAATP